MTQLESNEFNMPITYLDNKSEIQDNINSDLELTSYKEDSNENNLYDTIIKSETVYGKQNIQNWPKYFTTNIDYLTETQLLYSTYDESLNIYNLEELNDVRDIWFEIQDDDNFKHNFHYVEYSFAQMLNQSPAFLEILSLYNLSSPVFSLLMPILFLIIPFFLLKFKGIEITVSKYIEVLQQIMSKHAIGKLFMLTSDISWEQRIYIIISILFYFYQIYQNILCCMSFYNRMYQMHQHIFNIKNFINYSTEKMDEFLKHSDKLKTYIPFNEEIKINKEHLLDLKTEIESITPFSHNISKLFEIGNTMTIFYNLHINTNYDKSMKFAMGFIGYIDNITSIHNLYKAGSINKCNFTKKTTKFKDAYFAPLFKNKPIKNSYNLKYNMVITGPNAAGKTTLLKTTLFNIIFSQQTGLGFYKSANINPYDQLHCYLNIPDTSGRDSLFQAEARRCKEILDTVSNSSKNIRHFCIFDELYSGTNPYEAVASSYSLLEYLSTKNCNFLLTTHFIDLCNKLNDNKNIKNHHMKINSKNNNYKYTYKLGSGISQIKGGLKVLEGLNYPDIIIKKAQDSLRVS